MSQSYTRIFKPVTREQKLTDMSEYIMNDITKHRRLKRENQRKQLIIEYEKNYEISMIDKWDKRFKEQQRLIQQAKATNKHMEKCFSAQDYEDYDDWYVCKAADVYGYNLTDEDEAIEYCYKKHPDCIREWYSSAGEEYDSDFNYESELEEMKLHITDTINGMNLEPDT